MLLHVQIVCLVAGKHTMNTMLGTDARNDKVRKLLVQELGDSIVFARRLAKKKRNQWSSYMPRPGCNILLLEVSAIFWRVTVMMMMPM